MTSCVAGRVSLRFDADVPIRTEGSRGRIRCFSDPDGAVLGSLYARSVRVLGPRKYAQRQVRAWACLAPTADRLAELYGAERLALVAEIEGKAVAFGDVAPSGEIRYFYCHPDWAGKGVAWRLYDCLEASARAGGVARLQVEASEVARPFFERRGFAWVAKQCFLLGDVPIHNHLMIKRLRR